VLALLRGQNILGSGAFRVVAVHRPVRDKGEPFGSQQHIVGDGDGGIDIEVGDGDGGIDIEAGNAVQSAKTIDLLLEIGE